MPFTFDAHANLAIGQISSAPSPAISGTSLTVKTGQGALFPAAPFNCTVWPPNVAPLQSNAEIVRVTAVVGDILTITRAQEGTTAKSIAVNWQISNSISVKVITDLETAVNSVVQNISAGTQSGFGPQIVFANSNNITFGMSGSSQITASFAGGGGGAAISGGANSQSTGTVNFSNSNGVTFGLDGAGVMTASHNGLTSQSNQAFSASGGSSAFQTLNFANSNGFTFSNSNGSVIGSYTVPTQSTQPVAASASNGSFTFQTLGFSNANNVTFGTSAGSIITASIPAGVAAGSISAGANSVALGQVVFSNSNNVSFGLNGSTVTASASNAQSTQPVAASASNGSFLFSTLGFSNANGITFGTSAGSIITASVGAAPGQTTQPVAASASNGSFLFSTLGFSNANGVTFGTSAGSIVTASVGAGVAAGSISAGTTSVALGQVVFSDSNGVTFGLNGSTLTASIRQPTLSEYAPVPFLNNLTAFSTNDHRSIYFDPIDVGHCVNFKSMANLWTFAGAAASSNASATGQKGLTVNFGMYSRSVTDSAATNFSNSSNWVTMWTASCYTIHSWSASSSSISQSLAWMTDSTGGTSSFTLSSNGASIANRSITGLKRVLMPYATSFGPGNYIFAQMWSSSTAGNAAATQLILVSNLWASQMSNLSQGTNFGGDSQQSNALAINRLGYYSATTAAFPTSMNTRQLSALYARRLMTFFS